MKKNIPAWVLVIAVLLLAGALWKNHALATEQKRIKEDLLYKSFHSMIGISRNLESLITAIESYAIPFEECEQKLTTISQQFAELHVSKTLYAKHFPPRKISRSGYASFPDFMFVADTLVGGWGEIDGFAYEGITVDNAISAKEVQFLAALKEDVDQMIQALGVVDEIYRLREDISVYSVDNVIDVFFENWSWRDKESLLYYLAG